MIETVAEVRTLLIANRAAYTRCAAEIQPFVERLRAALALALAITVAAS